MSSLFPAFRVNMLLGVLVCLAFACDNPKEFPDPEPLFAGTGVFTYSDYAPLAAKPIAVFYHIPENVGPTTPIVFVFHGTNRNAVDYRNAWINKAEEKEFMIFAPRFTDNQFPGGDAYNLGNVFEDGDNPSAGSLNPEEVWTFSVIEPLFDHIKTSMENFSSRYHVFGHSAGAQFVHRLLMLKPEGRYGKVVASAAGWYTVPDIAIDFPYGIGQSPVEESDLSLLFGQDLVLIVGAQDNDPNAPALRRNSIVDQQGTHRLARAQHFFERAQEIATKVDGSFQWKLEDPLPGVGHDFRATSRVAADLISE
ncbi:MAG: hypothetical protein AAF587_41815 [Bacteroidota bacterium]